YAHPPKRGAAADEHPDEYDQRPGDQGHDRNENWAVGHETSPPEDREETASDRFGLQPNRTTWRRRAWCGPSNGHGEKRRWRSAARPRSPRRTPFARARWRPCPSWRLPGASTTSRRHREHRRR